MGKKAEHSKRTGRREAKELEPKTLTATINLHRRLYKATFKKKVPKAVKEIRKYATSTLFTNDVRIDAELNQHLWRNGVRNPDSRVNVTMERKKNEDEEAKEKFYTLVRLS
jgi:large subunit ribosomal protein L31e